VTRPPVNRWNAAAGLLAVFAVPACWIIAGFAFAAGSGWGWFFAVVYPAFLLAAALVCAHEGARRDRPGPPRP
jgi:hypothetical protein